MSAGSEKPEATVDTPVWPEGSLAGKVPQESRRARVYGLEDNGASNLSHRKRAAKDSLASRRQLIDAIRKRQAGEGSVPPLDPELADRLIAGHRDAIRKLEEAKDTLSPALNIIAPVGRRVRREDRRRNRKALADGQS